MKTKTKEILIIALVLVIQTITYIICGIQKSYIHMDEAYSLGLASYERTEIQDNEDFYNTWHTKDYYEDYLSVQEDEIGKYKQVYENQKNDVHPPLYYLILRFAMGFNVGHFSKWPGIIVNIIIFAFITVFMYLILQKLLVNETNVKEKAILLAFLSSITMASLTNVIYIRMYALATLNILITTFLHMKLLETEEINIKLLALIGILALVGVLTHYYYLFFLFMLYIIFAVKYIKQKQYKHLVAYTLTMAIAGIMSLIIFPYSIKHMFFGYRGQGAMDNMTDISKFVTNIVLYLQKLNRFAFNNVLLPIAILIIILCIYRSKNKVESTQKNKYEKLILLPCTFYFLVVAIASPWIELRYIMPVCSLIFIMILYYLYKILKSIFKEKTSNIIIATVLVVTLIMPFVLKIEPEVLYSDKREIVKQLQNELNVPTVFFFNSNNNRFLDDILLFATVDISYVAKDIEYTTDNIQSILGDKDLSKGIVVFINEGQENDTIIDVVKKAMNLTNSEYLKRLNACDVYYIN